MVPDRLCILADAAAAVVLAFSLDLARREGRPFGSTQLGGMIATGVAVLALCRSYPRSTTTSAQASRRRAGGRPSPRCTWPRATRSCIAPFPWEGATQVMRWQAVTGEPVTMIGGDFIAAGVPGNQNRAGRAGLTPTTIYMDDLYRARPGLSPRRQLRFTPTWQR